MMRFALVLSAALTGFAATPSAFAKVTSEAAPLSRDVLHRGGIWQIAFDSSGERFLTAGDDGVVKVWQRQTPGESLRDRHFVLLATLVHETNFKIYDARFIDHDQKIITTQLAGDAVIWDWVHNTQAHVISEHSETVVKVLDDAPHGRLFTAGSDDQIIVWDEAGETMKTSMGMRSPVAMLLNPLNGQEIISASMSGLQRWNAETGAFIEVIDPSFGYVSLAAADDQTYYATGSLPQAPEKVRLWNYTDKAPVREFEGLKGFVWSTAFSPGSEYLAASAFQRGVAVWRVSDGQLMFRYGGEAQATVSVTFDPVTHELLIGGADGDLQVVNLSF